MAARAAATRPRHCSSPPALIHVCTRRRSSPSRRGCLRMPVQFAVGARAPCGCLRVPTQLAAGARPCLRAAAQLALPCVCWRSSPRDMPEKWVALNISISGMMAAAVGGDGCVSSSEDVECKQPVVDEG
nr:uncharacterized protein LOC109746386 [Aegilops tauschii subsp. strangulata]